jgi:hypothetical protein
MNTKETLSGAYSSAKVVLEDGTTFPILVRRVLKGDNTYGTIVIDDIKEAFEKRFNNTATIPNDLLPITTETLTKKDDINNEESQRIRLISGDMVAFLGDPDRILEQKKLDTGKLEHLEKHPSSATMAKRICMAIGGKWAEVAKLIPSVYANRK